MTPRARPSTTTRSSISRRGSIVDAPGGFLLGERLVGAEEQLLAGLPARVEGPRHQRAAERAVGELSAVLARERHALRHGVIDDARRQLGQPVDVRLARPEVAALQRVVEEPLDAVAVVLIVLGGIDPALRGHAVGAAGRIVEAEAAHAIAELRQRGRRRRAGQPGADDDDLVPPATNRAHEVELGAPPLPARRDRARRRRVAQPREPADRRPLERRRRRHRRAGPGPDHRSHPASTAMGTAAKPTATAAASTATAGRRRPAAASGRRPRLRTAAHRPWKRCRPRSAAAAT